MSNTMDIKDTKRAALRYMQKDIPVFLWGAPGIGKSDAVRQIANAYGKGGVPVIDFRAILRDPVDLRGLPSVDHENGVARWLPPSDLPNEARDGKVGILFLDELNAAPQAVQAACFGLVLDRKVGEYTLPPGWRIIAAGNRAGDRAASQRMPTALANRFAHIDVEANVNDWSTWAVENDLAPEVIAFLRMRSNLLHAMDTTNPELRSFPTPRSWAQVAKVIDGETDTGFRAKLVSGLVGEGASIELEGFLRIYQHLPSLDAILLKPDTTAVPDKPDARYAIASGLSRKVTDGKSFARAITYMERMPKEFEIMFALDLGNRSDKKVTHSKEYAEWAQKNAKVIL